jgi:hypothetical protein
MDAQEGRSREYFKLTDHMLRSPIDPDIVAAFEAKLVSMPLSRDPAEILLKIEREHSWGPDDEDFLSSLSEGDYYDMLKTARSDDLRSIVRSGLQFSNFQDAKPSQQEIGRKVKAALKRLGGESRLNAMRVRPYVGRDEPAPLQGDHGEEASA